MALGGGLMGAANSIGQGLTLQSLLGGGSGDGLFANFGDAPWTQGGNIGGPSSGIFGGIPSNPFPTGVVPGVGMPTMPTLGALS